MLHHNGRLIGYYVGYKRYNSSSPYLYVTVAAAEADDDDSVSLTCELDDLDKYTLYGVHVQAYNAKGAGPRSADYVIMTLEDGTTRSFSTPAANGSAYAPVINNTDDNYCPVYNAHRGELRLEQRSAASLVDI